MDRKRWPEFEKKKSQMSDRCNIQHSSWLFSQQMSTQSNSAFQRTCHRNDGRIRNHAHVYNVYISTT